MCFGHTYISYHVRKVTKMTSTKASGVATQTMPSNQRNVKEKDEQGSAEKQ